MNKELSYIIKLYCIESHKNLNEYLIGRSKDNLIASLLDLLTLYINDKNSSTLREFITVSLSGYEHNSNKIGYNGFRQDSFTSDGIIKCEAKPKNINISKNGKNKLNGYGNFSDYTPARFNKDRKEKDLNILSSGFVDGKLIYILEFPFNTKKFLFKIKEQLDKKFKGLKSVKNQYLRSANFNFSHFKDSPQLRIVYSINKNDLIEYKKYINKDLFDFLFKNNDK